MINIKEAKKLNRPMTIDLKWIMAQEYLDNKKTNMDRLKEKTIKYVWTAWIIWFLIVLSVGWGVVTPPEAKAFTTSEIYSEHGRFLAHFPEEKTVIGCYNIYTKKARELWEASGCYKKGDHNITLPPRSHIVEWLKYFNEFQVTNRLALVNFESNFDETAENDSAKGYVQTLKSHGVAPDLHSQLSWLKKRQGVHGKKYYGWKYGQVRWCGYYWENNNTKDWFEAGEYGVLSCLYRYHYDANKGTWYAKKGIEATKFYKLYMFWIKY